MYDLNEYDWVWNIFHASGLRKTSKICPICIAIRNSVLNVISNNMTLILAYTRQMYYFCRHIKTREHFSLSKYSSMAFFYSSLSFKLNVDDIAARPPVTIQTSNKPKLGYVTLATWERHVSVLVISRLDYSNAVRPRTARIAAWRMRQSLHYSAVRLVCGLRPRGEALMNLHWLPVQTHIEFKLCVPMYKAYVTDVIQPVTYRSLISHQQPFSCSSYSTVSQRTCFHCCRSSCGTVSRQTFGTQLHVLLENETP